MNFKFARRTIAIQLAILILVPIFALTIELGGASGGPAYLYFTGEQTVGMLSPLGNYSPRKPFSPRSIASYSVQGYSYSVKTVASPRLGQIDIYFDQANPARAVSRAEVEGVIWIWGIAALCIWISALINAFRVARWEARQGVQVVAIDGFIPFWRDPFGSGSFWSKNLRTLRLEVIDRNGEHREVWLRFGRFFWPSLHVTEHWS